MITAAAILILCFALAACQQSPRVPAGWVTIGLDSGPITLDPRFATDATAAQIGDLLFDGLTRSDSRAERAPALADHWEMPDAQTYIFHLRDDRYFPDGAAVTATDVQATYESIRDLATQSPKRTALGPLARVDTIDPHTVRFVLTAPFAPFLYATGLGILPARQVAADPRPLERPLGSGPFRIVDWAPDARLRLERNLADTARPTRGPGLLFRVVPDAVTRLLELRRGTVDLVQNSIEPDALDWVRAQRRFEVATGTSASVQYIGINLHDPILADLRVRRAIASAIDRSAIVNDILRRLARPATGLLPPDHWAYSSEVATYPYDPDRARRLLDDAGYPDPDGNGPAPRLRLSFKTTTVELRRRLAEVIQEQLAQVGIALDVRTYEWATFYGDVKRGNFQLYTLAWVGIEDPDIYYLTLHSSQVPPTGANRGGFHDAEIDALTSAARSTLDTRQRRRLYAHVQSRSADLLPIIPLWWPTNVAVINRRLHGFELRPDGSYASLQQASVEGQ